MVKEKSLTNKCSMGGQLKTAAFKEIIYLAMSTPSRIAVIY